MDKSWLDIKDRADPRYIRGIDSFLDWAFGQQRVRDVIRCPCKNCRNTIFKVRNDIRFDLLKKGFLDSYKVWDFHGEVRRFDRNSGTSNVLVQDDTLEEENLAGMIYDAYGVPNVGDMDNSQEPNIHASKFYNLLKDAETELYPDCGMSKLSFIVKLFQLKCLNHWSNTSMDALLALVRDILPQGALVPNSFYEAKKVIRDLGLDYKKIDACGNDCILYWQEYANAQSCPKCKMSRWKFDREKAKKVPQ